MRRQMASHHKCVSRFEHLIMPLLATFTCFPSFAMWLLGWLCHLMR